MVATVVVVLVVLLDMISNGGDGGGGGGATGLNVEREIGANTSARTSRSVNLRREPRFRFLVCFLPRTNVGGDDLGLEGGVLVLESKHQGPKLRRGKKLGKYRQ